MNKIRFFILKTLLPVLGYYGSYIILFVGGPIMGTGPWRLPVDIFMIMAMVFAAVSMIIGLGMLVFRKTRSKGAHITLISLLLIILLMPTIILGDKLRIYGFHLTAQRAKPVIEAMMAYKKENHEIPDSLDQLVPKYLIKIPYGLPDFRIEKDKYGVWALTADVGTGILNWDAFIYRSSLDYSDLGQSAKPIGKWVYLYE